jgi:hypothetical protein
MVISAARIPSVIPDRFLVSTWTDMVFVLVSYDYIQNLVLNFDNELARRMAEGEDRSTSASHTHFELLQKLSLDDMLRWSHR